MVDVYILVRMAKITIDDIYKTTDKDKIQTGSRGSVVAHRLR